MFRSPDDRDVSCEINFGGFGPQRRPGSGEGRAPL